MKRLRVLLLVTMGSLLALESYGQASGAWPMFRGSAAHTGRSGAEGPESPLLEWAYDLGGLAYSSAAIDGAGTAYVGTSGGVHAVARDGRRLWFRPLGGYSISSPALGANGLVYVGNRDHNVYALDAATGEIRRTFATGDEVWASPTIGSDGTVFIGSFDGNLYALEPNSDRGRVVISTGGTIASSAAIGPNGVIYCAVLEGGVFAVNANGTPAWQGVATADGGFVSSPAIADGSVYIGSLDGRLYALDAQTGQRRWTFATGDSIVSSPAVSAEGVVYVGSLDGSLYAVTAQGQRWRREIGSRVISSPVLDARGNVYVASLDGTVHAFDPSGTPLWNYVTDNQVWSSISLDSQGGMIVSSTGNLRSPARLYRLADPPFVVRFEPTPSVGSEITALVSAPDEFQPTGGTLFYRRGGETTYRDVALQRVSSSAPFSASVPPEVMTTRGVEYHVSLTDGSRTLTVPAVNPATNPALLQIRVDGHAAEVPLAPRSYRMISIPLILGDNRISSVIEDDYGPPDPRIWRLLCWRGDAYREAPAGCPPPEPGAGYFLITQTGVPFDVDDAVSVNTRTRYAVVLDPGWNLIGNPFAFAVDWADVEGEVGFVGERAYFNGEEMLQSGPAINVLRPWEGMFVRNTAARPVTIWIPPVESETVQPPVEEGDRRNIDALSVRLTATTLDGRGIDSQNWVRFAAKDERDDLVEAPAPDQPVRLSLLKEGTRYARLSDTPGDGGGRWDLEVAVPASADRVPVRVTLEREAAGLSDLELFLVDKETGRLITASSFDFEATGSTPRIITLVAGTREFAESVAHETQTQPPFFELYRNYPNPFNPATAITFRLSDDQHVRLEIFNSMGQRVRTLVDGNRERGTHTVSWDGVGPSGEPVASGLYFYRMEAGGQIKTRSMILLR